MSKLVEDFLHLGVQRVLGLSASGRAFLQEHGVCFEHTPGHSNYFAALHSPRRRDVLRDVHRVLLTYAALRFMLGSPESRSWPVMKSSPPTATGARPRRMTHGMMEGRWPWAISTV